MSIGDTMIQTKILAILGIILIISISSAGVLEVPNENRDCYHWGTLGTLYMCFVSVDGSYAKWFYDYAPMHNYYTPQLKEINITAGETYTLSSIPNESPDMRIMITGAPSYMYVKNSDLK